MTDDRRDIKGQLDRILECNPNLIGITMLDFAADDPAIARVVERWAADNNAKLSDLRSHQLVNVQ